MGNNLMTMCGCKEKEKFSEHAFEENNYYTVKPESSGKHLNNIDDFISKNKPKNSQGPSDADTTENTLNEQKAEFQQIRLSDDTVYVGGLVKGKKSGKGVIKKITGEIVYEGDFKDDLYDGNGMLYLDEGLTYTGQFSRGMKHGRGFLFSADRSYKYTGNWEDDLKSGDGTETYPDGSVYIGNFHLGKKDGKGIYHMNDGSIYEGEFKDDKIEGYGRIAWKQDKQYEGQWSNNSLNGFGLFLNKGKYYVGYFVSDKKQGKGFYSLPNGNIMIGHFKNGEIDGLAIILLQNGEEHMCFMENGVAKVIIKDTVNKNNIKIGTEYKEFMAFYEKHKDMIKRQISATNANNTAS